MEFFYTQPPLDLLEMVCASLVFLKFVYTLLDFRKVVCTPLNFAPPQHVYAPFPKTKMLGDKPHLH